MSASSISITSTKPNMDNKEAQQIKRKFKNKLIKRGYNKDTEIKVTPNNTGGFTMIIAPPKRKAPNAKDV